MLRFLTDEDFNGRIIRGLSLRNRDLDLVRIQDLGLSGATDDIVLLTAEKLARVLLSHDARTMPRHFRTHLAAGSHVPGVFIVDDLAPIGTCIDDIELLAKCSDDGEWEDQLHYVPFK